MLSRSDKNVTNYFNFTPFALPFIHPFRRTTRETHFEASFLGIYPLQPDIFGLISS